jgi:hypothetical protein
MTRALAGAMALSLLTTPTSAQVGICGSTYVTFLERISTHTDAMSGKQIAALHRRALRIFDACDSGHQPDVQSRLRELERRAY